MDNREVCTRVPARRVRLYNVERFERQFQHRMVGAVVLTGCFVGAVIAAVVVFL